MDTSNFKEVFESPKVKALTAQVAEREAEIVRLREALEIASGFIRRTNDEYGVDSDESEIEQCVQSTLSTLSTPTALLELIEKVEKMTIERCAVAAYVHYADTCRKQGVNAMLFGKLLACGAIRALHTGQIKLEELL